MGGNLFVAVRYIDLGRGGLYNPLTWNKLLEGIRTDNSMTTQSINQSITQSVNRLFIHVALQSWRESR